MTFSRDPLSVEYDGQARLVVGLAIDQHEKRRQNTRLVPYVRVRIDPARGQLVTLREAVAGNELRLSRNERAFQRACYYDGRIHQFTGRKKPLARWSLKLEWEDPPIVPGRPRYVRVQVFGDTDGARHAERLPAKRKVSENPDLRSAGIQV